MDTKVATFFRRIDPIPLRTFIYRTAAYYSLYKIPECLQKQIFLDRYYCRRINLPPEYNLAGSKRLSCL